MVSKAALILQTGPAMSPARSPEFIDLLQRAMALHQAGALTEAGAIYAEVLVAAPEHAEALQLAGILAYQTADPARALDLYDLAIVQVPDNGPLHANRGLALQALDQPDAAILAFRQALSLDPTQANAQFNLGVLLQVRGEAEAALACYEQALLNAPDMVPAWLNLGAILRSQGNLEGALIACDRAIGLEPENAAAHANRGNVLKGLNQPDAALGAYDLALSLEANSPLVWSNRAMVLQDLGRWDEALQSCERAIGLHPDDPEAWLNQAVVLRGQGRLEAALASLDQALALNPNHAQAWSNRGNLLTDSRQIAAACESFDRAISLAPDLAEAHWGKGLACLVAGDFEVGLPLYEWRWRVPGLGLIPRGLDAPLWRGEVDLAGKTLLVHTEQGLGDSLQFCRYMVDLKARGARVVLEAEPALYDLFKTLEGVDQIVERGSPLPPINLHCPLLSLPLALGARAETLPDPGPYLKADPAKILAWDAWLEGRPGPRVGLVWSGGTLHRNDRNRSLALDTLIPALPLGPTYVCLQKDLREADRPALARRPDILWPGAALTDFTDTAALCDQMDLIISVDTSVAHLSGALGRPTWLLLPYSPDWRWQLDRTDSPWYSSLRLYRQAVPGDWASVLAAVQRDLGDMS